MSPVFAGKIRDGVIQVDNQKDFEAWLRSLEGRRVEFAVWKPEDRPTLKQHAYYRIAVRYIADELGYPQRWVHRYCKMEFMPMAKSSTAQLTKQEFIDFIEHVLVWAAERGIVVPPAKKIFTKEMAA